MFRSIVGRFCTYGFVFGVNALPFVALAAAQISLPIVPPQAATIEPDAPEAGDEGPVVRWSSLPAATTPDDNGPDEVVTVLAPPAPPHARPTIAPGGGSGAGATTEAPPVEGPAAAPGEGEGEGVAKADEVGAGKGNKGRRPKGSRPRSCEKPHPNIHPADDGIVEIDRRLVDEYTKDLESFMKLGYSRPYDEEGVNGWYISGFSCTSPIAKAGFQRGDVLLRVNGKKTRSWVGVFLLYQRLKHKDAFEVEFVRKGEPMTLKFRVIG